MAGETSAGVSCKEASLDGRTARACAKMAPLRKARILSRVSCRWVDAHFAITSSVVFARSRGLRHECLFPVQAFETDGDMEFDERAHALFERTHEFTTSRVSESASEVGTRWHSAIHDHTAVLALK